MSDLHDWDQHMEEWLRERHEVARRLTCRDCGAKHPAPILWGYPVMSEALRAAESEGMVVLGGCIPLELEWHCRSCRREWATLGSVT